MPYPTPRLALLVALASVLLLATGLVPGALPVGLALDAALVALAIADGVRSVRRRDLAASRALPPRLCTGQQNHVVLRIENRSSRDARGVAADDCPIDLVADRERIVFRAGAGTRVSLRYAVTASGRGEFAFGDIHLRWRSPWGLLSWQAKWPCATPVRVYPRYVDFSKYHLEYRSRLLREAGPQRIRTVVRGGEFESLRDYVPGDDTRQIDWKATARHQRLTVRNHEEERSKSVLLVLDAGRMMSPVAGGLSKLDHAINAALMLCSAAVTKGDRVGLMVFDDVVRLYLPPRPGVVQSRRVVDALCDVHPELIEPDYGAAFTYLSQRSRRRSLTVLFTDLVDSAASDALLAGVASLRPHHLPMLVSIRDQSLERATTDPMEDVAGVYQRAVAEEVLEDRERALARLRARGVVVVDASPDHLSVSTVNQYLLLKAENRL